MIRYFSFVWYEGKRGVSGSRTKGGIRSTRTPSVRGNQSACPHLMPRLCWPTGCSRYSGSHGSVGLRLPMKERNKERLVSVALSTAGL